jgi:hypothetical protein
VTARGNKTRDLAEVAAVARSAHAAGGSMSDAIIAAYGLGNRRSATALISRARAAGHTVPYDLAQRPETPAEWSAVRRATVGVGAHTITLDEYRQRMATAERPLTEPGYVRFHQSDVSRLLGSWR